MFKKRIKSIIALVLAVVSFFTMSGFSLGGKKEEVTQIDTVSSEGKIENSVLQYPATNEFFRYNVYTYYIEISECLTTNANVVIPDTIQDLPVLKIAENVFKGVTTLKTVTMTNNIVSIGANAFSGCINLSNITLSSNLEELGSAAFFGCYNLKAVSIPGKLQSIPSACFSGCSRLMAVSIEESEKKEVSEEEATGEEGSATQGDRKIEGNAFLRCVNLRSVWIPSDVSDIADSAFTGSLEFLTIYGQAQSAAASYASRFLVDFVVLGNESFREILTNANYVEERMVGDSIEGEYWKINLSKVYVFRGDFKYYDKLVPHTRKVENGKEMIVYCFIAKNISSSKKFFNILNANPQIDGYNRKVSAYGRFADERLEGFPDVLAGDVEAGELIYGYVAVEAPRGWQNASIQFSNDMLIESNVYKISAMSDDVIYIGSSSVPQTEGDVNTNTDEEETSASDILGETTTILGEETATDVSVENTGSENTGEETTTAQENDVFSETFTSAVAETESTEVDFDLP